jgi:hypothetical protein
MGSGGSKFWGPNQDVAFVSAWERKQFPGIEGRKRAVHRCLRLKKRISWLRVDATLRFMAIVPQ